MTERAEHTFTVKEFEDGTPWVALELHKAPELPILERGFLGFDLRPGTTLEQARELANHLNKLVSTTNYTAV